MSQQDALVFKVQTAKQKPENIRNKQGYCPFCDLVNLKDFLAQDEDRIWLMNKYRTLEKTVQTLIVESSQHEGDIHVQTQATNAKLLNFIQTCYEKMQTWGQFKSIVIYKNFGPKSGGSLRHPHFQIVGMEEVDAYAQIAPRNLTGISILKEEGAELNISDQPVLGFTELNVQLPVQENWGQMADLIKFAIRYFMEDHLKGRVVVDSYNLFLYPLMDKVTCKIVPCFNLSPYGRGYLLAQVNDQQNLLEIKDFLQEKYRKEQN
ncbi:DUF4931 domain-containing protein [Ligilactobacillus equi]|uniref:DUF4931 domain-containing protein n=1 Tax=Ligilactobacillus equi TaxID=137357 RepID=UPI002ED36C73